MDIGKVRLTCCLLARLNQKDGPEQVFIYDGQERTSEKRRSPGPTFGKFRTNGDGDLSQEVGTVCLRPKVRESVGVHVSS